MPTLLAGLALLFVVGSVIHAAAEPERPIPRFENERKATSTVYRLRLRDKPDPDAKIVGHLRKGEEVTVVQQSTFSTKVYNVTDSWYEVVNSSGVRGWVFGYYLQTEGNN